MCKKTSRYEEIIHYEEILANNYPHKEEENENILSWILLHEYMIGDKL